MSGPNTSNQVDNVAPAETIKAGWDKYNAHWHPISVLPKSALYTLDVTDVNKLIHATANTWTLSLPAAATAADGFWFAIRNAGTGVITIDPNGAELIDGVATITVPPSQSMVVVCTGTAWVTVGRSQGTWAKVTDAGTASIDRSSNIASITDNGTGDNTLTFTNGAPDANYAYDFGNLSGAIRFSTLSSQATGSFRYIILDAAGNPQNANHSIIFKGVND